MIETNEDNLTLSNPDQIRDALTPVEEWATITPEVRVHPVPAGHAPGAAGFVLQAEDGSQSHHLLATGDFTTRAVAGYPGLPTDFPVDIDVVFLTAASAPDSTANLTDAIETVRERAHAGSTVLTTASGLTGVHLGYVLSHLNDQSGRSIPVTTVGRTATLWESFGYEHPTVETVPEFSDPNEVLDAGQITVAGPEVPVDGSAGRLFDRIDDDPGATLVQVTSGAFNPETGEHTRGTVYDYQVSNHPTNETIDEVVGALDPIHVVVAHQRGSSADRYKDKYDSFVWTCEDDDKHTLYDDEWVGPPWVTEATRRRIRARQYTNNSSTLKDSLDASEIPLPVVERSENRDLVAEGIDVERLTMRQDTTGDGSDSDQRTDIVEPTTEAVSGDQSSDEHSAMDAETVLEMNERLARIEDAIKGRSIQARVIDAGDGITLLRPLEDSVGSNRSHGDVIEITLSE